MASSGSFETSKTTYNNYTQSCIFSWNVSSDQENLKHTVSWELTLKNGYATIYGSVVSINGVNYSTGNLNVSAPGNTQYSRKYINKGTVVISAENDGLASLNVAVTVHIAATNLNSTGSKLWSLPQLLRPDEYLPIINSVTLEDVNASTLALTGNNQRVIVGYSNVKATYSVSAQRGNTITKVELICGTKTVANSSSSSNITINNVESNQFKLKVTDSKSYTREVDVVLTDVGYIKPTIVATTDRVDNTSDVVNFDVKGVVFGKTFGGVANTLALHYRTKESIRTVWSDWTVVSLPVQTDKYETTIQVSDFDYVKAYDVEMYVADKLSQSLVVPSAIKLGIPDFWHNSDHLVVANDLYTNKYGTYEKYLPVKVVSAMTPSSVNVGTLIYEDDSIMDNYMVLGYMVYHSNAWYQWYNTAVNGVYIQANGIYMMLDSTSITNKPIMLFLMRIE